MQSKIKAPSLIWIGIAPILTMAASPCISRTHSSQVNLDRFGWREGKCKKARNKAKANKNLVVKYLPQIYTYHLFCLSPSLRGSDDSRNEGKEEKKNLHLWLNTWFLVGKDLVLVQNASFTPPFILRAQHYQYR